MVRPSNALRRVVFGSIFALLLCGTTLIGIEALASFFAPAWPARALRWTAPINPVSAAHEPYASRPWMAERFNSWGMRDKERSIAKDPAYRARAVAIGDSFAEASFARRSLPASVEAALGGVEAIDLGISATGPPSYYYRLRDVGLELSPDVVLLFVYMGNDFVLPAEAFGASRVPPLIGESEGESLLGAVMPRAPLAREESMARPGGPVAATAATGRRGPALAYRPPTARRRPEAAERTCESVLQAAAAAANHRRGIGPGQRPLLARPRGSVGRSRIPAGLDAR